MHDVRADIIKENKNRNNDVRKVKIRNRPSNCAAQNIKKNQLKSYKKGGVD